MRLRSLYLEIGMSHLGLKKHNACSTTRQLSAERVYAPWPGHGKPAQRAGIPLLSLEIYTPLLILMSSACRFSTTDLQPRATMLVWAVHPAHAKSAAGRSL